MSIRDCIALVTVRSTHESLARIEWTSTPPSSLLLLLLLLLPPSLPSGKLASGAVHAAAGLAGTHGE
jgi:hypothetical protein